MNRKHPHIPHHMLKDGKMKSAEIIHENIRHAVFANICIH